MFEHKVKETISEEHDFRLLRLFKQSPDKKWTVIHNRFSGTGGFHELQFYDTDSGLQTPEFILNEADKDSIAIYDFEFSKDGERLFVTYQLSDGRSRNIESYFGNYDLQTGEFYESDLRFPWSLNPYYTAYSPKRNEIYTIGAYREFHIIDTETNERKQTTTLSGKKRGSSQILISPDEDTAFVSAWNSNTIFVIDLNKHEVIHAIDKLEQPYFGITTKK